LTHPWRCGGRVNHLPLLAVVTEQPDPGYAGSALMIGHVTLEAFDVQRAASHSPAVVRLLRKDWGYDGVLLTDDLNMGAVYDLGIGKVASEALAAGVDVVLVSYDPRQVYRAIYGAATALSDERLTAENPAASRQRLTEFPAGQAQRQ